MEQTLTTFTVEELNRILDKLDCSDLAIIDDDGDRFWIGSNVTDEVGKLIVFVLEAHGLPSNYADERYYARAVAAKAEKEKAAQQVTPRS